MYMAHYCDYCSKSSEIGLSLEYSIFKFKNNLTKRNKNCYQFQFAGGIHPATAISTSRFTTPA